MKERRHRRERRRRDRGGEKAHKGGRETVREREGWRQGGGKEKGSDRNGTGGIKKKGWKRREST